MPTSICYANTSYSEIYSLKAAYGQIHTIKSLDDEMSKSVNRLHITIYKEVLQGTRKTVEKHKLWQRSLEEGTRQVADCTLGLRRWCCDLILICWNTSLVLSTWFDKLFQKSLTHPENCVGFSIPRHSRRPSEKYKPLNKGSRQSCSSE